MELRTEDVAVVTGAASGIGLALVRAITARGLATVMTDVRADRLEAAAEEVRAGGGKVTAVVADVSRAEDVEQLAERAVAEYGHVDVVCNNAGVTHPGSGMDADRAELAVVDRRRSAGRRP